MTFISRIKIAIAALVVAMLATWGAGYLAYSHAAVLDAGIALPDAGSASAPAVTEPALPDAATTPVLDQGSFAWKLYKSGHLVPALIVAAFFLLFFLEKKIAWLRTGYRKVVVASALGGLGMLAERVASGTSPNVMMVMGALGAALTMVLKTQGEPKKA